MTQVLMKSNKIGPLNKLSASASHIRGTALIKNKDVRFIFVKNGEEATFEDRGHHIKLKK
jgi:hypothetical protein